MLRNDVAAHVDERFCISGFICRVEPRFQFFDINHCIGVDGLNAERERVDAGAGFRKLSAVSRNIANLVGLGLKTGCDTCKVARLINSAEVVVQVRAVALIARTMGEDDIRMLVCQRFHSIHITVAGAENHVAALRDAVFNRVADSGGVLVGNVQLANNLIIGKAEIFLHTLNAEVMRVGIAGAVCRVTDVDYADFQLILRNRGDGSGLCLVALVSVLCVAASGEAQHDHDKGQENAENFFHVFSSQKV